MLTREFWKTAQVVVAEDHKVQITAYDSPWADIECTSTHCGTGELSGIHANIPQSCRAENIVSLILEEAKSSSRDPIGHFVYYCPISSEYSKATRLLKSLGFKKISTFTHFGYLTRKPDYGRAQMWSLCLTHAEKKRLEELDGSVD